MWGEEKRGRSVRGVYCFPSPRPGLRPDFRGCGTAENAAGVGSKNFGAPR